MPFFGFIVVLDRLLVAARLLLVVMLISLCGLFVLVVIDSWLFRDALGVGVAEFVCCVVSCGYGWVYWCWCGCVVVIICLCLLVGGGSVLMVLIC